MDSWPVDYRTQEITDGRKDNSDKNQNVVARGYLQVNPGGPNAVILVDNGGRLQWSSLSKQNRQPNHLHPGKYTTIFPAARSLSEHPVKSTILQSAERGANFLRTYLPDVDIPAELIRDELSQDAKITEELNIFNPYMGNLLQPVVAYDSAFLAFPMGELNCELNLSSFRYLNDRVVFKPTIHPTRTFDTPIQQIATSLPGMQTAYMAVRTFGGTSLLEVNTSKITPYLAEVTSVSHNDTGGRALVDVILSTAPFSSLAVNDLGSVYQCTVSGGDKNVDLLRPVIESEHHPDFFWRLARGLDSTNYLLSSKHSLVQVDIRSQNSIELFTYTGLDIITSVEDQSADYTIKLSSTGEVLWIDARFPHRPLLGFKHGREYDRSLRVRTSPLLPAVTLLTSRANAMVTLYDVSRSKGQPIHINAPPTCFIAGDNATASYVGETLFRHPFSTEADTFSLIRLSQQGGLHRLDLSVLDEAAPAFDHSWSAEVKQLDMQSTPSFETPYADQAFSEADFSLAYDKIFRLYEQERGEREDDNANAVYDLLETMPTFWQEIEAPLEHILTMYDVALRAGDEPLQTSRADFLTESILNSTRGYRALVQDRLSPVVLKKGAPWHKNITATLQRLDPTFPNNAKSGTEALKRFDLAESSERSAESIRYEKDAREQLTLDLALSADVFSPQPFLRSSDEALALETLTKTLSLAGEPPTVDFGYLRPRAVNHYNREDPEDVVASLGVRSLLREWQIGTDPKDYTFADRYDGSAPQAPQRMNPTQPVGTQVQRPPAIVAASAVPVRPPELGRRAPAQSQPDFVVPPRFLGFGSQITPSGLSQDQPSQEYMTSTQILPGLHGGRPTVPKKKAKKRVGGF